ncbi:hypothetical protein cyc_08049 [Cyclospora cayetanensis]|uniref:Uncharacterized protein n=1 Tax=Cyclospora cayetanensis TaxID=88456 RepID=A0A1D3D7X0_9EIME|nr:hypothetical protein cyc_08049 [Cyclospora cayetanensis]
MLSSTYSTHVPFSCVSEGREVFAFNDNKCVFESSLFGFQELSQAWQKLKQSRSGLHAPARTLRNPMGLRRLTGKCIRRISRIAAPPTTLLYEQRKPMPQQGRITAALPLFRIILRIAYGNALRSHGRRLKYSGEALTVFLVAWDAFRRRGSEGQDSAQVSVDALIKEHISSFTPAVTTQKANDSLLC